MAQQKKKVKIIQGSTDILIIAPHGVHGKGVRKDTNTDILARLVAKELGCSAIINDSIKRSECDYNRISQASKDKRFISGIRKVLDADGPTLVVWIHGLKEKNQETEKALMKVAELDCLIGYGQPDNLSSHEETATNLIALLQKHGIHAYGTRKEADNYRGADPDNMNQWFQKQKAYKSLDKVQSLQLEFALSAREKDAVESTAKAAAASLSAFIRPVQPYKDVAVREPQKAQLVPAGRLEAQIRASNDISELKDIQAKAEALRIYVRKAEKNFAKQNQYAAVKIRAQRRCGEILASEIEHGGDRKSESRFHRRTLKDLGIKKNQSCCWQAVAELPKDLFEKHLTETREAKKELTSAGVYRRAFEFRRAKDADAKPLVGSESVKTPISIKTGTGDFMNYIDQFKDVAAIITDPPYGKEHLDLFGKLGQFAAKVLKPGGSLLTMAGVYHLPKVIELMTPHLNYYWTIAYHMPAKRVQIHGRKIWCNWKPILWFVNGKYEGPRVKDVLIAAPREKGLHPWQQSEEDFGTLIEMFTKPGDLIVDPFYGSGTLGAAAMMRNRDFFGIEKEPKTVETAENRLRDMAYKIVSSSYMPDENPAKALENLKKNKGRNGDSDKMDTNLANRPEEMNVVPDHPPYEDFIPTNQPGVYTVKLKERRANQSEKSTSPDTVVPETDPEKPLAANGSKYPMRAKSKSKHNSAPGKKKRVSGVDEWTKHKVNFCTGCENDCLYCYMKPRADRTPSWNITSATWHQMRIRQHDVGKKRRLLDGMVAFPTSHDILPFNIDAYLLVLRKLLDAGNEVLIVSKPRLACIQAICEAAKDFKKKILFRFTIGAMDDEILSFWEPNAPKFGERTESLRYAFDRGFRTSVSTEPMLQSYAIEGMVNKLLPHVNDAMWIGKMKYLGRLKNKADETLAERIAEIERGQTDKMIWAIYNRFKDNPKIKWKDSIKKVIGLEVPQQPGMDI